MALEVAILITDRYNEFFYGFTTDECAASVDSLFSLYTNHMQDLHEVSERDASPCNATCAAENTAARASHRFSFNST
jgi:hypothetical protein